MSNKRRQKRIRAESSSESELSDLDGLFVDELPQPEQKPKNRRNGKPKSRAFDDEDPLSAATEMDLNQGSGKSSAMPRSKTAKRKESSPGKAKTPRKSSNEKRQKTQAKAPIQVAPVGSDRSFAFSAGVLTCVKGPEQGLALKLIEGSYTIGRGRDNHFVLKDIAASRVHVRVEVEDNEIRVVDLGSGNGTKVNGKRIKKSRTLEHGDSIRIGKSVLEFTFVGDDKSRDFSPRSSIKNNRSRLEKNDDDVVEKAEVLARELSSRLAVQEEDDEDLDLDMEFNEAVGDMVNEVSNADVPDLIADDLWNETQTQHADAPFPPPLTPDDDDELPPPPVPNASLPPALPKEPSAPKSTRKGTHPALLAVLFLSVAMMVSFGGFAVWFLLIRDGGDETVAVEKIENEAAEKKSAGKKSAEKKSAEKKSAEKKSDAKNKKMASLLDAAATALEQEDLTAAKAWAEKALNLKPGHAPAVKLLTKIERVRASREGKRQAAEKAAQKEAEKVAAKKAADDKTAIREAAKAKVLAERAATERAASQREKARAAQKAKTARRAKALQKEKAARARARARAKEKARARARAKAARSKMGDAEAKRVFKQAIRDFRDGDEGKSCSAMKKIVKKAESSSTWRKKADSFRGRKCR